jgi:hypothetical protein
LAGTYASSAAAFKAATIASSNLCDLNQEGTINIADVQLAMARVPCTASIDGPGVCNIAAVQRVVNAAPGGTCITSSVTISHAVSLISNDVYEASVSGGAYTKVNASLAAANTFTDRAVQAGQPYYRVCTAVNSSGMRALIHVKPLQLSPFRNRCFGAWPSRPLFDLLA